MTTDFYTESRQRDETRGLTDRLRRIIKLRISMAGSDQFNPPPDQRQLHEILVKIVSYQHSLPDGRAVDLDELRRESVLSPADLGFLALHSVTYKPHPLSDHHGLDMLHMPTEGGGCVFLGPRGPEPVERTASVVALELIIEGFLKLPRPKEELSLCIEFTAQDYLGVSPGLIGFGLRSSEWCERLPAIRSVAGEFGLETFQDAEVQGNWILTFRSGPDPARAAAAAIAVLLRGCGFTVDTEVTYSAGALDQTDGTERSRQASSPKLMKIRLTFSWLLAVPMFLLLLLFAFCCLGSLILIPMGNRQGLLYLTGSFFYLLCAHLLYAISYLICPPLYLGPLKFIRAFFHPLKFVIPLIILYLISLAYLLHYFRII